MRSLAGFRVRRESRANIVRRVDLPAVTKIDCMSQLSLPFVHTSPYNPLDLFKPPNSPVENLLHFRDLGGFSGIGHLFPPGTVFCSVTVYVSGHFSLLMPFQ